MAQLTKPKTSTLDLYWISERKRSLCARFHGHMHRFDSKTDEWKETFWYVLDPLCKCVFTDSRLHDITEDGERWQI